MWFKNQGLPRGPGCGSRINTYLGHISQSILQRLSSCLPNSQCWPRTPQLYHLYFFKIIYSMLNVFFCKFCYFCVYLIKYFVSNAMVRTPSLSDIHSICTQEKIIFFRTLLAYLWKPQNKILLLMAWPLRPNPPSLSSLMAIGTIERWKKRFENKSFFS